MSDPWLERWNERYSKAEYAFGETPNDYLKEQIEKLQPGSALFAAEGEGRNAVFAATLGWNVSAFDISPVGRQKALRLAAMHGVTLAYEVGELTNLPYKPESFDLIALIYAHFPAAIKSSYHRKLHKLLRKGGHVIFEAFSKNHLEYKQRNPQVGGPSDVESLFSIAEITAHFPNYEVIELKEEVVDLREGPFHSGVGSVIRFVGSKK